ACFVSSATPRSPTPAQVDEQADRQHDGDEDQVDVLDLELVATAEDALVVADQHDEACEDGEPAGDLGALRETTVPTPLDRRFLGRVNGLAGLLLQLSARHFPLL